MSRAVLVAALAAAVGCDNSACRGVDGTCVALTVTGMGSVDGVQLTLSGAASGTKVAPATAEVHALPVEIGLQPPSAANGPLHIDAVGVLYGSVVGTGSADVSVSPGAHTSATIELSPGGSLGGGGGGAGPFDVTGTRVLHYQLGDGGVVDVPGDSTRVPIAAEVLTPDGGITSIAGSGDANGNIAVHRVPSAPYYLRFGANYVYGSAKTFDLDVWIGGRPDQIHATKPTTLGFSVTNLDAWASGDTLELFSLNAGTAVFGLEALSSPGNAATTYNGSFDLSKVAFGRLLDAAKGDDAFLIQLVADSNNGVPYQRLSKIVSFAPFTITDGGSASASGAMSAVTQSSLPVAWTRSQFAQYRAAVNPQAVADGDSFTVFAMPGGTAHGWFTSTPDVLVVQPAAGTTDVALTASYGNPFPSSWPLVGAAGSQFAVTYAAAGASSASFDGAIFTFAPLASLPSPVAPVISPVQSFTVDGRDALGGVPTASPTAALAWSAPAIGTASSYSVIVYGLENVAGSTSFRRVATLHTRETSVRVPPGVLAGGQDYLFVVTAYADAIDPTVSPFLDALPTAYADALSGGVHVQLAAEAASCKDLHTAQPGLPDGIYTIDPDGSGGAPPVAVYCDMTTGGGGWTLCAWSNSSNKATRGWVAPSAARTSSWFGCHLYSTTPVEALARVANATMSYSAQYPSVDLTASGADRQYTSTAAPALSLGFTPNEGACNNASTGNLQWSLSTTQSIYGLTPKDTCGTNHPTIFIGAAGVNTNGCWGSNQVPPEIGYPCGGYGNYGVHLELWVR